MKSAALSFEPMGGGSGFVVAPRAVEGPRLGVARVERVRWVVLVSAGTMTFVMVDSTASVNVFFTTTGGVGAVDIRALQMTQVLSS